MNIYIQGQIVNMQSFAKTFLFSCRQAALKNDGSIDRDEERLLKEIEKATEKYLSQLNKLK